jgi:hypothetical protein
MKCKLCRRNLTNEADKEYDDDEDLDYEVLEASENSLCRNCLLWNNTNYDVNNIPTRMVRNCINNLCNVISTIEYVLICLDCKYQTPYSYLWLAICDGREHVLTSKHKIVTITEIVWQNDKASEILRIQIKCAAV